MADEKRIIRDVSAVAADTVTEKSRAKVQELLDDQPSHTDVYQSTLRETPLTKPVEEPVAEPAKLRFEEEEPDVPIDRETHTKAARAAFFERPERMSAVRNSVLPGYGSPGFKLFQLILGGTLLAFGLFFEFQNTDAEGASFMSTAFLVVAFFLLCYEVVWEGIRKLLRGKFLDSDVLVAIACIGGVFIGQFPAATAGMFLYVLAMFLTSVNASHSDALFGALEDFDVDEANVARNGVFVAVAPEEVRVGETILVQKDELVPLDGVVAGGTGLLDTVLLTGDTTPKYVFAGDKVAAGTVVLSEELQIAVTAPFEQSTAQRVADLLYDDSAAESREGEFARKFSTAFGIVVILLGLALGIVPSLITGNWHEWMRIAFTFLMLAGTAELLLQGPLCFENGLGTVFYNGVVVRGDGPFEQLAHAEKVVFNKTGTLTKGEPDVIDIIPAEGYTSAQLLETAAKAEALSDHRIAACIAGAYGKPIDKHELKQFSEVPGLGVSVFTDGHRLVAGNVRCMLAEGIDVRESHQAGNKLHVAADGKYLGCIVTSDTVRRDSREAIEGLHGLGLDGVTMLTGGPRSISKVLAEELSVDEFGSELAPEDKLAALQTFASRLGKNGSLIFVGDGVKDAGLLRYADAGVALGAFRSPEVLDSADAVIIPESPSRIVNTIRVARRTFSTARTNTVVTIVLKAVVMVLAVVGLASLWAPPAVTLISALICSIGGRRIRGAWETKQKK